MKRLDLRDKGEIYCLTSPSGKQYIGQAIKVDSNGYPNGTAKRWKGHIYEANKYKHRGCWLLNQAIRKYGADNFKVEILEDDCDAKMLGALEAEYIKKYNTLRPNGYNISLSGINNTPRKRDIIHKKMDNVPKYIAYYECDGQTGYRVEHPDLKTKAFISSVFTMEEKTRNGKKIYRYWQMS